MRWFYIVVVAVFVAVLLILVVQNFQSTTLTFLGFSLRMPLAILAIVIYVLGMATGGSLWALLRRSIEESRR